MQGGEDIGEERHTTMLKEHLADRHGRTGDSIEVRRLVLQAAGREPHEDIIF